MILTLICFATFKLMYTVSNIQPLFTLMLKQNENYVECRFLLRRGPGLFAVLAACSFSN